MSFICPALQLQDTVLNPAFDAGAECSSKLAEIDQELQEHYVYDSEEEGRRNGDIPKTLMFLQVQSAGQLWRQYISQTYTNPPALRIFIDPHSSLSPVVAGRIT
jgi:hypothetical protein